MNMANDGKMMGTYGKLIDYSKACKTHLQLLFLIGGLPPPILCSINKLQVNYGKWQAALATTPRSWMIQPMVIALRRLLVVKKMLGIHLQIVIKNKSLYTFTSR